jgi:cytochrome d ubiquinol oxidase subunit II
MVDLALVWTGLIAFAVFAYVVLDGFDLGIGILFPLARSREERGLMMNTVAPVWDGNETWLVFGGGGLLAAFPLAYAVVLTALYVPVTIMLLALIFRGVSFEFRWRTRRWQRFWDFAFFAGSLVATFSQGVILGALVQGIRIADRAYAGGWFDWLSPFSLLTGVALVTGYGLLGATWLVMKTGGDLQQRMREAARWLGFGTFAMIGLVSLVTPFLQPVYFERWFDMPARLWTMIVPLLVLWLARLLWTGLARGREVRPFLAALGLFAASFAGLGISFYPMIVPPDLTIREAAAPRESLAFTLVGALLLVPVILGYTACAYRVFRGKVQPGEGCH